MDCVSRQRDKDGDAGRGRRPALWVLLTLALGLFYLTAPTSAQPVIDVEGALDPATRDRLDALIRQTTDAGSAEGGAAAPSSRLMRDITRLMRSEGYYGAMTRASVRDDASAIWLSPGRRFVVRSLTVTAHPPVAADPFRPLEPPSLATGDPLRADAVIAAEARTLAWLQDHGWPDAALLEREVVIDHGPASADVTINVQTGVFSRMGDVAFNDPQWDPSYIASLNPAKSGDVASLSVLRDYQARLAGLSSVAQARVQLAEPDPEGALRSIEVSLTSSARHVLEAGLSLSTSEGGGGMGAAWTRRNLMGRDETFKLTARLLTQEQALETTLSAPHWRRYDQTLGLLGAVRNEITNAYDKLEAQAEIDVTRRLRAHWDAGVKFGFTVSQVTSAGEQEDIASVSSGISAVFDTRDSSTEPTAGLRAALDVLPALTFGDIQSGFVVAEARLRSYRRLGDHFVAAARLRVGGLSGASLDAVPADDRFYAGGGGSVRGFEFQSLGPLADDGQPTGGRSVVEASAELRWRGQSAWGAAIFADAGVASTEIRPDLADLRVGIGAGVRYHFEFAPLRFDVAVPLDRRSDEASFHLYLGLGQAF